MTKTVGQTAEEDPGKQCVFPFKSGNSTYHQCVHGGHGSWCATEVTAGLVRKKWGYCHSACPGGTYVGPSDVGGTCPSGSGILTVTGYYGSMDHCCCGDIGCCWNKCTRSPPPEDCLPPGAEWKYNSTLAGHYQAVPVQTKACMTKYVENIPNDDPGKPCVFPFLTNGVTYNECVDGTSGPWCATEVDTSGAVVDNKYGFCNAACPGGMTTTTTTTTTATIKNYFNYLGCYKDSGDDRLWNDKYGDLTDNSPRRWAKQIT